MWKWGTSIAYICTAALFTTSCSTAHQEASWYTPPPAARNAASDAGARPQPDAASPLDASTASSGTGQAVQQAAGQQGWHKLSTTHQPPARIQMALAYDDTRHRIVLFGGYATGSLDDTWELDGSDWQQISTQVKPPARRDAAMAYDSDRHEMVLFGGTTDGNDALDDTWQYDGTRWQQVDSVHKPSKRHWHALGYDALRKRVVLSSGVDATGQVIGGTWEYDGQDWAMITTSHAPAPRRSYGLAYDSARSELMLFGGTGMVGASVETAGMPDLWAYDGKGWTQIDAHAAPGGRWYHCLAYLSHRQQLFVYGGWVRPNAFFDTWLLSSSTWTDVSMKSGAPDASWGAGCAYDAARDRVVLFGGSLASSAQSSSTWVYE